jgi:hypothetical protein
MTAPAPELTSALQYFEVYRSGNTAVVRCTRCQEHIRFVTKQMLGSILVWAVNHLLTCGRES